MTIGLIFISKSISGKLCLCVLFCGRFFADVPKVYRVPSPGHGLVCPSKRLTEHRHRRLPFRGGVALPLRLPPALPAEAAEAVR